MIGILSLEAKVDDKLKEIKVVKEINFDLDDFIDFAALV